MKKVKICGLKSLKDISYINEFKPNYAGVIFAPSKRQVDKALGKEILNNLRPGILKVGVFTNESIENINYIVKYCDLDIVQLHGDEEPDFGKHINARVWKAFRISGIEDLELMERYHAEGYLLDTYSKDSYGGTGKRFNWDILKSVTSKKTIILAGGINADNVTEALDIDVIDVLDVSSGVETAGTKDKDKIKILIEKVRNHG
ncbi:phosphoribosylanthranilate isomerase [Alkalibacter mobilis]|uniref:phosphoribosylanthranilate isomerase n=1 Tax=Alkalibacter mobilis TaxID=2787712 RepID=UPI00189D7EA8|nr:phosphoribosylanthranilate isomerase [Alkalibacter mobilis]MBF7096995.1 phosphoribosylanthranilate isomerase [Alkalibacter mobilis]